MRSPPTPTQTVALRAMALIEERLQVEGAPVPLDDLMALTEAVAREGTHWSWTSAWKIVRQWAKLHPHIRAVGNQRARKLEWVRTEAQGCETSPS
jgi:hypothetical protein